MTARFLALPVNGDAFLFRRDRTFMIDAGSGRRRIQALLREKLRGLRIDVLVCTHNDAEHAKGVPGVLREPTCSVGEVWLPAEFLETLEESLRLGIDRTIDLLRSVTADPSLEADLDEPPDAPAPDAIDAAASRVSAEVGLHAIRLSRRIEHVFGSAVSGSAFGAAAPVVFSVREAAAAMANIALIAAEAAIHGVPVIWLRHMEHGVNGRPHASYGLTAINATRIARTRPRPLLRSLFLTPQNRRALVLRADVDGANDVLFCSDSALGFQTAPMTGVGLFTAPHHGSPSNDFAYTRLPTSALVVRSDHARAAGDPTPSAKYLAYPQRGCTLCRGRSGRGDIVEAIVGSSGGWAFAPTQRACRC